MFGKYEGAYNFLLEYQHKIVFDSACVTLGPDAADPTLNCPVADYRDKLLIFCTCILRKW